MTFLLKDQILSHSIVTTKNELNVCLGLDLELQQKFMVLKFLEFFLSVCTTLNLPDLDDP